MNTEKLYIVIPAYNEEANIAACVRKWHDIAAAVNSESWLVILNDGSKDGTQSVLESLLAELPRLKVINKPNQGHGATLLFGYKFALEAGADYIFQTDSDGQTLPREFWSFWDERKNYALIIGYRRFRGDGFIRFVVTKVLKVMISIAFKVNIKDANTPFRLMRAAELKNHIKNVPADYFLANTLLCVIYSKYDKPILFIPIIFRGRQGGVNSLNLKKIIKIGFKALAEFPVLNKQLDVIYAKRNNK